MPLGGSITLGVGSSKQNGYREGLLDILRIHNFHVYMVGSRQTGSMDNNNHEGWRGFRIDQIARKAKTSVKELRPNIFTVNAGSNDCLQNFDLDHIDHRMDDMLEYLWSASPGSTVILSTLLVNSDAQINSRVVDVNQKLRALADSKLAQEKRIILAEMYSPEGPQICDLIDDGIHPNDTGYIKMANIWFRNIQEAAQEGLVHRV